MICIMALGVFVLLGTYLVQRIRTAAQPKRCLMNHVFVQMDDVGREWLATDVICIDVLELERQAQEMEKQNAIE
jgi:hypothetical protein